MFLKEKKAEYHHDLRKEKFVLNSTPKGLITKLKYFFLFCFLEILFLNIHF